MIKRTWHSLTVEIKFCKTRPEKCRLAYSIFQDTFNKILFQQLTHDRSYRSSSEMHWLVVWCLMPFPKVFQLYRSIQCTYPCFPWVLLTNVSQNILRKPLAAFPHNRRRNNEQLWERNVSCRNDYHQSSESMLAVPRDRTSDILFSSLLRYPLSNGARLSELEQLFFQNSMN